jgi:F-box and leucine-rich repeat protein GRR1
MAAASGSGSAETPSLRHQQTSINPPPTTDHASSPLPPLQTRLNGTSRGPPTPTRRTVHGRAFGHPPIVEISTSPAPSDVASNRSTGTNHSNGAGFFRTYHEVAISSTARSNGALTPDLDFAEIGHGRGTGQRVVDPMSGVAGPSSSATGLMIPFPGTQSGAPRTDTLSDPSTSYRPITWPHIHTEASTPPESPSPTRQLHNSLPPPNGEGHGQGRDPERRGRSVKRSLRNISHVAEHLASSFLFGRTSGGGGGMRDEPSGSGTAVGGSGRL